MNPLLARGIGGAVGLLGMLGLATLSHAPYRLRAGDQGMIRLTWRARPERIETCRIPSTEELARIPAHMRQQLLCDGFSARYRLTVALGGTPVLDEVIRGSGLRHDRPMYLLRDLPAPPGPVDLDVRFSRVDSVTARTDEPDTPAEGGDSAAGIPNRSSRETEERQRRRLEAVPPALLLHEEVTLAPRQVLVVSYDAERRRLVLLSAPPQQ